MKNGNLADDGPANAYLHAYWSVELTKAVGIVRAKEFTDAHESGIFQIDEYGTRMRMDLYNNMIGRALAQAYYNKDKTSGEIVSEVLEQGLLATSLRDPKLQKQRTTIGKGCPRPRRNNRTSVY